MHTQSFLIISKDSQKLEVYLQKLYHENQVGVFDKVEIAGDIGIEEVRNLKKNVYLAPLNSPQKAVIIKTTSVTKEAQNALLKILEEPPNHTIIILCRVFWSFLCYHKFLNLSI